MLRRLIVVLLTLALVPLAIPSPSAGSLGARRNGKTAERPNSHGPIASITESLDGTTAPARTAQTHHAALGHVSRRYLTGLDAQATRHTVSSARVLRQGVALVPLRL